MNILLQKDILLNEVIACSFCQIFNILSSPEPNVIVAFMIRSDA